MPDGAWRRLDEFAIGDHVRIGAGPNVWAEKAVALDWKPTRRFTLTDAAEVAGVDVETVIRYRNGTRSRVHAGLAEAVARYDAGLAAKTVMHNKRRPIRLPEMVDESLGAFLGYLIGDGHISEVKRVIGLTTADQSQADNFARLTEELFGVDAAQEVGQDKMAYPILFRPYHRLPQTHWIEDRRLCSTERNT